MILRKWKDGEVGKAQSHVRAPTTRLVHTHQTFSSFLVVEVKDRSPVSSRSTSISVSTVCLGLHTERDGGWPDAGCARKRCERAQFAIATHLSREIVGHPAMAAGNNFSMSSLVCNCRVACMYVCMMAIDKVTSLLAQPHDLRGWV